MKRTKIIRQTVSVPNNTSNRQDRLYLAAYLSYVYITVLTVSIVFTAKSSVLANGFIYNASVINDINVKSIINSEFENNFSNTIRYCEGYLPELSDSKRKYYRVEELTINNIFNHKIYILSTNSESPESYIISYDIRNKKYMLIYSCKDRIGNSNKDWFSRTVYPKYSRAHNAFNKLLLEENIELNTEDDVLGYIKLYLLLTYFNNKFIIINNYNDVLNNGAEYCKNNSGLYEAEERDRDRISFIAKPKIRIENEKIEAEYFTWSVDIGILAYWHVNIDNNIMPQIIIVKLNYIGTVGCPTFETLY